MTAANDRASGACPDVSPREASYPLLSRFLTLVLPVLGLALGGLLVAVATALSGGVERAYAAETGRLHALINAAVGTEAAGAIPASGEFASPTASADRARKILDTEVRELGLAARRSWRGTERPSRPQTLLARPYPRTTLAASTSVRRCSVRSTIPTPFGWSRAVWSGPEGTPSSL